MLISDIQATDLDPNTVAPRRELRVSNTLLGNPDALDEEYERYGYLFFRNVLDHSSIDSARMRMIEILTAKDVTVRGSDPPLWNGKPLLGLHEESAEYRGISAIIFASAQNIEVFEAILNEPICQVPIVQYRSYPPQKPAGGVHQDGFHSPGITGYRPIWVPLMNITRQVGGLALAEACNDRGFFHNLAKPPAFPIPEGVIPDEAWVTTDYRIGDLLVVHPHTPHTGMANASDRFRLSIDTRVQSARSPTVLLGDVEALSATSVTLRQKDGVLIRLAIDDASFIRTGDKPQERLSQQRMLEVTPLGTRLVVARNGEKATMMRRASEG